LKTTSDWYYAYLYSNGTDDYEFSALPGGGGYSDGIFDYASLIGFWWSSTERDASYAWARTMRYNIQLVYNDGYHKSGLYSVRCVQD
jgi:uncharacterized protein (TIGR02145 family)